jgi:DNA-binding protein HU-beta
MNKSEFISFMSVRGCTKAEAEAALNLVLDSIVSAVAEGKGVNLVGFGSWNVARREGRNGHNPKTGVKMLIPAYNQPVFKAGQRLKDACNGKLKGDSKEE